MILLIAMLACAIVPTGDGNFTTTGECTLEDVINLGKGRGAPVEGFHCPLPGPNPSGCHEWDEGTIDIGAGSLGYLRSGVPNAPSGVTVSII